MCIRDSTKTGQKEADFIPIVIWGKQAESAANYLSKGSQAAISGRIQTRSYDAKDGTKRYVTEVVADPFGGVQFLGSKGNNASGNAFSDSNEYSAPVNDPFNSTNFDEDITPVDDGDMPFQQFQVRREKNGQRRKQQQKIKWKNEKIKKKSLCFLFRQK
eukprot:TRINITY_DN2772_c0_g1_i5.p2 TRINITY_DN2772_c0_g1~~TRINITY_DN2772_c0_g1_i5.p2  ORF type:complete len:159 (+),score=12.14 TRINITY_DN2772_c0_g1_i5:77-553(+)